MQFFSLHIPRRQLCLWSFLTVNRENFEKDVIYFSYIIFSHGSHFAQQRETVWAIWYKAT